MRNHQAYVSDISRNVFSEEYMKSLLQISRAANFAPHLSIKLNKYHGYTNEIKGIINVHQYCLLRVIDFNLSVLSVLQRWLSYNIYL